MYNYTVFRVTLVALSRTLSGLGMYGNGQEGSVDVSSSPNLKQFGGTVFAWDANYIQIRLFWPIDSLGRLKQDAQVTTLGNKIKSSIFILNEM